MENEKRNRYIVIIVVCVLLLIVFLFAIYAFFKIRNNDEKLLNVRINQLYSSDYNLNNIDNTYFIGTYDNNTIDVIIDNLGHEVYKSIEEFKYDSMYKMKDGKYLIYSNNNNKLITYTFDGKEINKFYEIDGVSLVKPILYKGINDSYIIGFASMVDDDLYLYNLNNSGILVINDSSLVGDFNDNGIYFTYNENYLVVKNNDNLMGVVDTLGNVVIDYKYYNIINTYDDSFIAVNDKNKYGIIDKNDEALISFKYSVIDYYNDYYLIVDTKNKMALYSNKYEKITDFDMNYDSLIEFDLRSSFNSINLYKVDGKVVVVNNYLEAKNGIEYDKHTLYIIDGNNIVKKINQVGFDFNDVLYTYDDEYNVSIYDNQFNVLFEFKLDNVKKIDKIFYASRDVICVSFINNKEEIEKKYFDSNWKEVPFGLGELVIKNTYYYGYLKENKDGQVLTLYDLDGNYLDDISGNKINIYDDYIIIDNSIYQIKIIE
ncbi:MAG: hypothetical protein ACI4XM_07155 [Candidatus Coprovivens sp.]